MKSLIVLRDIFKIYQTGDVEIRALDGINLTIGEGEFTSIIGTSGSGKSTLMNILGCLDFPTYGSYLLDGIEIRDLDDNELSKIRNQKIGFIFQSFNLIPSLNALENVELQLSYRGMERKKRRELAQRALEQVGLSNRMYHRPNQMSGGQQQRVAIARAIAVSPPIILADEPTGNLDSRSAQEVMKILLGLNEQGKTIVLITHDPRIAAQTANQIQIADGKILNDVK